MLGRMRVNSSVDTGAESERVSVLDPVTACFSLNALTDVSVRHAVQ